MLLLALAWYALTGQPVWVQDGAGVDDAWFCQILLVLPDAILVRVDNDGVPYHITIPIREVRAVRERYPTADRRFLASLLNRPDDQGPGRAPVPR